MWGRGLLHRLQLWGWGLDAFADVRSLVGAVGWLCLLAALLVGSGCRGLLGLLRWLVCCLVVGWVVD